MDMNPMPMDGMPMDDPNMGMDMGDDMSQMGGFDDTMGENPYDTNFDAGVEADEENDPKHYIEQLSGKLSQTLRTYQDSLPQPDADTAKYAAGMVVKAAIDGLSNKDVKDILAKLDTDEGEDDNDGENNDSDNEGQQMDFDGLESVNRHSAMIDEIFGQLTQTKDEEPQQKRNTNDSYRKKPFVAPQMN